MPFLNYFKCCKVRPKLQINVQAPYVRPRMPESVIFTRIYNVNQVCTDPIERHPGVARIMQ